MIRRIDQFLWGIAAVAGIAGTVFAARVARPIEVAIWVLPRAGEGVRPTRGDAGDLARQVALSDPFRFDRRPSELPFGAAPVEQGVPERFTARAPEVSGIVGPPWRAALEGVPGREGGVLVGMGDTLAGWRVMAVRRDTIVIQAKDTTWRLAVRRP